MSAKFWFYPQPDGRRLIEIDLGEDLGELFSDWDIDTVDGRSMDGGIFRSVGRGNEIITIQRDRLLLGEEVNAKLWAMQNHLDRGYNVAFSADHTKSSAIPVIVEPTSLQTSITLGPDTFSDVWGYQPPSPGERYVLMTGGPGVITEMIKVDTASLTKTSGGSLNLDGDVVFTYDRPVFLRWWRSWPMLKRPQADVGKNIVTNEGGRLWSLNLRLTTNNAGLFASHPGGTLEEWSMITGSKTGENLVPFGATLDSFDDGPEHGAVSLAGSHRPTYFTG